MCTLCLWSYFYPTERSVHVEKLADDLKQPDLELLICIFLAVRIDLNSVAFDKPISVFSSAIATFYAPSDKCGPGGMRSERIRATPVWRNGEGRYDCVFIKDPSSSTTSITLCGLHVARVHTFFSFTYRNVLYQLALIHDFEFVGKEPDEDTGMWIVRRLRHPRARIVSLDAIYRAAHLIPVYYGEGAVPRTLTAEHSLDHYHFFYVNKFIDHHTFEIARKY